MVSLDQIYKVRALLDQGWNHDGTTTRLGLEDGRIGGPSYLRNPDGVYCQMFGSGQVVPLEVQPTVEEIKRDAMIAEIIELRNVPRQTELSARARVSRLDDDALVVKLNELRQARAVLDRWSEECRNA